MINFIKLLFLILFIRSPDFRKNEMTYYNIVVNQPWLATLHVTQALEMRRLPELKQITLWKKSNICRNIINGIIPLDSTNKMKVKNSLNMNITKIDVNIFPKVLAKFPNYNETIYKGVFYNDILLDKLTYDKALITNEYYSFYKSIEKARSFGYNIILRMKSNRTFDLSDEVILDKNVLIQVAYKEELTNLVVINLIEI